MYLFSCFIALLCVFMSLLIWFFYKQYFFLLPVSNAEISFLFSFSEFVFARNNLSVANKLKIQFIYIILYHFVTSLFYSYYRCNVWKSFLFAEKKNWNWKEPLDLFFKFYVIIRFLYKYFHFSRNIKFVAAEKGKHS